VVSSGEKSLLDQFRLHLRVADTIATLGLFSYLFGYVTGWKSYIPGAGHRLDFPAWWEGATNFFNENGAAPILGAMAVAVYVLGRNFARYSVEILPLVFTDSRTPTAKHIDTPLGVMRKIYGQLALLIFMVATCNYLLLFSPALIALHAYYFWFDTAQRRHMGYFFHEPKYSPEDSHPHKGFIEQRRDQVLAYLSLSHRAREFNVICFAAAAFALYVEAPPQVPNPMLVAYIVVIAGMLLNEIIIWVWRNRLKTGLDRITAEQIEADVVRGL
jgi:hypothetical protein